MIRSSFLAALGAALFFLTTGCKHVPEGRSSVDAVTVRGNDKLDADDVTDKIATTPSDKFLGLFRGILYDYSVFDRNVLQRDLARVEAVYREHGFFEAHARAGRIYEVDAKHTRVEIVVEEGPATLIREVRVDGLDGVPRDIADLARKKASLALVKDARFEQEAFDKALAEVRRTLTDRGYAYVKVENDAKVDLVAHRADVVLTVKPGAPCVLGPVTIEGLGPLPEDRVRRTANLKEGAVYSEADLDGAQQALLDLGVFASVEVKPELPDPPAPNRVVPIRIKAEPSRLRTIRLGGGFEFDALKTDVHGLVGWEHKNFFGGLRTFSVSFKPGIVLYPIRVNNITAPTNFLPEGRLRLELMQPGLFEPRTNGFVRPEISAQALLLNPNPPPNQPVIGYAEARNSVGLERTIWRLSGTVSHNLQAAQPFVYVGRKDPTLGPLLISYPELLLAIDLRNDRVHPRRGIYLLNTLQVAGGPFGGGARDVKVQPDLRGYIPITKKRVTLALRGSFGFLFAQNYGGSVQDPRSVYEGSEERTRDYQFTFFRGFFSGGPTSNRGYPLRGVGPHDFVPFLSPDAELQRVNLDCGPGGEFDCRSPTGGFSIWEASAEVRFVVDGPLSMATFCDASDVSPRQTNIRLNHPHLSCGAGARYDTPVGPVRLDVGYRIPGLQTIGGLTREEREPETFPLGIPIAVSFGIGEAF
ncbi:MAG: BamA/TamA family outer membrane protein [Labilithrix sp.]|nr:BamA/TamA family outer membrane protein [Labilithrix sp.]MCW5815593.1 BamA/TamA family outer membrane protein [Labilithrix sp.]